MPQGFEFYGSHETDFFYELDGDIAYDSCFFGYKSNEQYITVKVSKIGVPYDCMYMLNNPTVSNINGVKLRLGASTRRIILVILNSYLQIFLTTDYNTE